MTEPTPEQKVEPAAEAPAPAQPDPKAAAPADPAPVAEQSRAAKPKDPAPTPEQIEAKLRAEYEAKLAEAAEKARVEERERLEAEQAEAAAKAEKERLEAEMSEVERAEAQRIEAQRLADEAQRLADEATKRAEATDKENAKLGRQLEFQRALSATGHALARDQSGAVDPALERLAFEEVERTKGERDMATALRDLAAVKPWMFHRGEAAPANSSGGPATPPARRIDPATPPQTKPVFEQTPEEYAKTRRTIGIVR